MIAVVNVVQSLYHRIIDIGAVDAHPAPHRIVKRIEGIELAEHIGGKISAVPRDTGGGGVIHIPQIVIQRAVAFGRQQKGLHRQRRGGCQQQKGRPHPHLLQILGPSVPPVWEQCRP